MTYIMELLNETGHLLESIPAKAGAGVTSVWMLVKAEE